MMDDGWCRLVEMRMMTESVNHSIWVHELEDGLKEQKSVQSLRGKLETFDMNGWNTIITNIDECICDDDDRYRVSDFSNTKIEIIACWCEWELLIANSQVQSIQAKQIRSSSFIINRMTMWWVCCWMFSWFVHWFHHHIMHDNDIADKANAYSTSKSFVELIWCYTCVYISCL